MKKKMFTPTGDWRRHTDHLSVRPMQATLFRLKGTWWLRWKDGKEINLHHATNFRKADMLRMLTS